MIKKHFKLYKSGKKWCVMAFATVASIVGLATVANADDVNTTTTSNAQTTQVAEETPATSTSDAASSAVQSNSVDAAEQTTNVDINVASPAVTPVQPQDTQQKNGWVNENNNWTYYQNGEVTSGRDYTYLPTIN